MWPSSKSSWATARSISTQRLQDCDVPDRPPQRKVLHFDLTQLQNKDSIQALSKEKKKKKKKKKKICTQ
eukprot:2535903-Amphidinium_carterae.1